MAKPGDEIEVYQAKQQRKIKSRAPGQAYINNSKRNISNHKDYVDQGTIKARRNHKEGASLVPVVCLLGGALFGLVGTIINQGNDGY